MRVRLTPSAERDLDEIEAYICADNVSAAIDTVLRVIDSIRHVGDHPDMGRAGSLMPMILATRLPGSLGFRFHAQAVRR